MFGWRRKNDGFEWHKYVRTTIKLRRDDRRRRIEDFKDSAVEGAQMAGAASASAGRAGLSWLGRVLAAGGAGVGRMLQKVPGLARRFVSAAGRGARHVAEFAVRATALAWIALRNATLWVVDVLRYAGVAPMLAGAALAAAVFALLRAILVGAGDLLTITAAAVAAVLAVLFLVARGNLPRLTMPAGLSGWRFSSGGAVGRAIGSVPLPRARTVAVALGGLAGLAAVSYGGYAAWNAAPTVGTLASFRVIGAAPRETVAGRARAISGDTISVAGRIISLEGIEAPELGQICRTSRGRAWRCGRAARRRLARLTGRSRISCEITQGSTPRFYSGTCTLDGANLAARMVELGYGFATGGVLSATFSAQERAARDAKRGVWKGTAERPKDYRQQKWTRAKERAPGGCPIKGRVVRRNKVYVLPWSPQYRRVRIRKRRGERWFCSEDEAIAAGWRPANAG